MASMRGFKFNFGPVLKILVYLLVHLPRDLTSVLEYTVTITL